MNTLEIIQEMNANPALADELRSVLLSKDLLSLPEHINKFDARFDTMDTRFDQVDVRLDTMDTRFDQVDVRLDTIDTSLGELKELGKKHENDLTELKKIVTNHEFITTELSKTVKDHDVKLGWLIGLNLESNWIYNAPAYGSSLGVKKVKVLSKSELADLLDDPCDAGKITDSERNDVLLVDSVASAIHKADGSSVYVVSEISSRLHLNDVERVIRRSILLEQALNVKCIRVVAGGSIDEASEDLAKNSGVFTIIPSGWSQRV